MSADRGERRVQAVGPGARSGSEVGEVVDRGDRPGEGLVAQCAGLEPVPGRVLVGGPDAVGRQALGELAADRRDTEMRTEELVGRAEQHVGAERIAIEPAVRRQVHPVRPGERPGPVRRGGDPGRVADVAERVRGQRVGDHAGALADQRLQRVEVERAVGRVDRSDANLEPAVLGGPEPGADVGVVVELGDDHLVPGLEGARDRVREQEVERGHVGAEGDLAGLGPHEVRRRLVRGGEQRVGLPGAAKAPPAFAFERSRYPPIASITAAGTCEPPGPSK